MIIRVFGVMILLTLLLGACSNQEAAQVESIPQSVSTANAKSAKPDLSRNTDGFTDISVQQLTDMLDKQDDVTLVNVHIPFAGNLPGTDMSIPFNEIGDYTDDLPAKGEPIVLYCRSGNMSTQAAKMLAQLGYTNLYELDGGFDAWVAAGRALESPQ